MLTSAPPAFGRQMLLLVLILFVSAALSAAQTGDDFSIVVLPDPQNYSQYYPQIFQQQTQWVVDHRAERNIQLAADMPVRTPVTKAPPVAAPLFNWTGLSYGVSGGYGWGSSRHWW